MKSLPQTVLACVARLRELAMREDDVGNVVGFADELLHVADDLEWSANQEGEK